ncbi:integrase [Herbidospora solisilvae]|nr:integrase [Herbidospora solisilvae]
MTMVSVAARPGRVNEDFTGATPTAAVLVDGAGIPGAESTCRHGVAWYAHTLGGSLLSLLSLTPGSSLPALLAEAITQVTDVHRHTCDVTNPISPSAAVAVLRVSDGDLDHLVLGDAVVALDRPAGPPIVTTDPRELSVSRTYEPTLAAATPGSDEYNRILADLRARRNQPGGFWVAKDDPRAADEAVTGRHSVSELSAAVLLSNGAGRIVDPFGLTGWPQALAVLASNGPAALVDQVRRAEAEHATRPDDATIAYCTDLGGP